MARDWNPADKRIEVGLGEEERRIVYRLIRILEKWLGVEAIEKTAAELSRESDKLEADATEVRNKLNRQTGA